MVAALVSVVLWGSGFVGIRAAAHAFSPGGLALGRLVVSTTVLGAVAILSRQRLPSRRALLGIALYGVLWLGVYSVALNAAEQMVDAGTAAMLVATGPILIAILGGLFLGEGFPLSLFVGCGIALAGSVLIGVAIAGAHANQAAGILLCIVAVVAYSIAIVVQKVVLRQATPLQVSWLGSAAATLACLPFAPTLISELSRANASAVGWAIYLGAFPIAVGFLTWTFALRRATAGRTASFLYLVPPVAILLGWGVLGEIPPWLALIGGALCLAGVFAARQRTWLSWSRFRWHRPVML
ncbi:MAG TPA: DMT family transporter [Candidatus Dormibacteraeota bacterium]